ncbi:MAG: chemotaxis protein CheV [Candidatus Delongbacteria bacterium]|nr:chemotaxis protein CheV [Candidatus Delongbacteria bacterium]
MKHSLSIKNHARTQDTSQTSNNEFELIEFILNNQSYGINVGKIREVIELPVNIYPVPKTHPCLKGVTNIRNEIISIIGLKDFLSMSGEEDSKKSKVIITEFNNLKMGFVVDMVTRIYRLSWEQVSPPDRSLAGGNNYITSIIKLEDKIILMLDFERIVFEINAYSLKENPVEAEKSAINRRNSTIMIAEDSEMVKSMIERNLSQAGYQVVVTSNGIEAFEYLESHPDSLDMIITDIEMPKMDGYSLCKKIKDHKDYKRIPVVIFSSLISPEVKKKGDAVGADAQIVKPDLGDLIAIVDDLMSRFKRRVSV